MLIVPAGCVEKILEEKQQQFFYIAILGDWICRKYNTPFTVRV